MRNPVKRVTKVSNLVYSKNRRATMQLEVMKNSFLEIFLRWKRNMSKPVAKKGVHVGKTYQGLMAAGRIFEVKQSKTKQANARRRTKFELETSKG